jgi:hypothetical protein
MIAQTSAKISAEDMNPPLSIAIQYRAENGPAPEPSSKNLPWNENLRLHPAGVSGQPLRQRSQRAILTDFPPESRIGLKA